MRKVHIQFLDQGFHRVLFDAIPIPVFVVDEDVCVLEYNAAATRLLQRSRRAIIGRRCGDLLHCLNATKVPEGCGRAPACRNCVVRNSVRAASRGRRIVRRRAKMAFGHNGKITRMDLLVSCQPFTYGHHTYFLLILEGF